MQETPTEEVVQPSEPSKYLKRRLRPRTYAIAVYLVGLFFVVEMATVFGVSFVGRQYLETLKDRQIQIDSDNEEPSESIESEPLAPIFPDLPSSKAIGRLTIAATPSPKKSELDIWNDEARELRKKGDLLAADKVLRKALTKSPQHSTTLVNLAMNEEERGNMNEAIAFWGKVIDSDQPDDSSVRLAKERLIILSAQLKKQKPEQGVVTKQPPASTPKIDGKPADSKSPSSSPPTVISSPAKSSFTAEKIASRVLPANPDGAEYEADYKLIFQGDASQIDPKKMRIQIRMYDEFKDGQIKPAKITAGFVNAKLDWQSDGYEVLRAKRLRADTPDFKKYYGYLLRIYYEGELQVELAEPTDLLARFPAQP